MYDDWFACKMPSHDKHVFYNTQNVSTILSIQSIPAKRFLVPFPLATKTRTSYQPPYHFLIEASWIFHTRFSATNSRKKVKSMDEKYLFLRKDGLCKSHWFMKVSASWQSISKNYTPRYLTSICSIYTFQPWTSVHKILQHSHLGVFHHAENESESDLLSDKHEVYNIWYLPYKTQGWQKQPRHTQ